MLDLNIVRAEIAKQEARDTCYDQIDKLAALYAVLYHKTGGGQSVSSTDIQQTDRVKTNVGGRSDFLLAVDGMDAARAWAVMDDLMSCLRRTNSKMYESTMRRLNAI